MTDLFPANTEKLVDQLTKIETKLKEAQSEMSPEDRQKEKGKGHPTLQKRVKVVESACLIKPSQRLRRKLLPVFHGSQLPREPISCANCVKNMVVLITLTVLLSVCNEQHAATYKMNGKVDKPLTSMSIRMLVPIN